MVPYMSTDEYKRPSVKDVLAELARFYDDAVYVKDEDGNSHIVGLLRPCAPLSIEPGAQIEISIGPCKYISQIETHYTRFRHQIDPILQKMGYKLATCGYHPTGCASDIPLIPKNRYIMMDKYFDSTGELGINMMRGSASTQVSIDYCSEEDAVVKMQVATALGPLFYFIFDNAPIFESKKVGVINANDEGELDNNTPYRMARATIWNDVDPARSMAPDFLFEDNPSYYSYAKMLMQRPPILTLKSANDDSSAVYHGSTPLSDIYKDKILSKSEIEHVLSMFFFDVRLKQYIEIRQPDSMPIKYALSFAALIKGIFYGKTKSGDVTILKILHNEFRSAGVFSKNGAEIIAQTKAELKTSGYGAIIYGRKAIDWACELVDLAYEGLESLSEESLSDLEVDKESEDTSERSGSLRVDELLYLKPFATLVSKQTTLVEHALDGYANL